MQDLSKRDTASSSGDFCLIFLAERRRLCARARFYAHASFNISCARVKTASVCLTKFLRRGRKRFSRNISTLTVPSVQSRESFTRGLRGKTRRRRRRSVQSRVQNPRLSLSLSMRVKPRRKGDTQEIRADTRVSVKKRRNQSDDKRGMKTILCAVSL